MTSVSLQVMTEVSVLENGQSPGNTSDASKTTMLMMSRPSAAGFPSPPYNSPSHQPIKEEDEEENFPENSSPSSSPQQNSSMEVDRMNHEEPNDEQDDDQHGRNDDDVEQEGGENENSMDSYVREDYAGKTVKSLLDYNKNAGGRRGFDEEVTEDEEEEEEDDEGKLVIDANDQILEQAAAAAQQQQQLLEAKLRCSAGIVGPGNKSSSSRPSSASPRGSPGALHGGQANSILNMMMTSGTMSKDRLPVNGHGQQHQLSRSYHQNHHHHNDLHSHHHHERHPYHNSHHRHGGSNHVRSHPRSEMIKSERKSARSPLIDCDVKSEGLQNSLNASSIGNALLNLASLGSLASIPNLLPSSTTSSNSSTTSSTENLSRSLSGILSQQAGQQQSLPFSTMNTPLNLTNSNGSNSYGNNALNNTLLTSHLAQLISQQNNNLLTNNLLNSAALAASASSTSSAVGSNTHNGSNSTSTMPQLLLASGQIVQGIQGAQLLIPTSGGLMSQTILTIPLNQPGAVTPPSSYPASVSPQLPAGLHHHHHHQSSSHHQPPPHHHHHGARGHPISPPVAPTVPPAASPDFSDHPSALPAPNLNLGPHSVGSQMGAHIPMVQDKLSDHSGLQQQHHQQQQQQQQHRSPSRTMINGNTNRREMNTITTNGGLSISALIPQGKSSPCNSSHDSDAFSDNDDSDQMVDGINLDEIKEFAKAFKLRRLSLGLTQTQVGQALSVTEGPAYSQSAICSALAWQLAQSQTTHSNRTSIPQPFMFEKLDITPKSAQKIKPVLERWMKEAEDRYKNGHQNLNDFVGMEPSKKRKRRTSFTPQALEILNTHFDRNTHPSGAEITTLAHQLGYEREVIRIWFCNKRQALKNTVRMMSKGSSPM